MTKLSFYSRYGKLGASSRYRCYMYADQMNQEKPNSAKVYNFFSDRYLEQLYRTKKKSPIFWLTATIKRLCQLCFLPKQLLIEYELLPFLPAKLELLFLKKRSFILNFDDFVQLKYANIGFLRDKFQTLMAKADGVICANEQLINMARCYNSNIIKIPTAISLASYRQTITKKFDKFTVVWIGSPATYHYLQQATPQLQAMAKVVDFELLVIGGKQLESNPIPNVNCRYVDWSSETEIQLLKSAHVGIMPLPKDDQMAMGKSAFKLIQYCASNLPAIASDVGENRYVIQDGKTGFLAETPEEWANALAKLANDQGLYQQMAEACESVAEEFDFQNCYKKFTSYINRTFAN